MRGDQLGDEVAARSLGDLARCLRESLWFRGRWDERVQLDTRAYEAMENFARDQRDFGALHWRAWYAEYVRLRESAAKLIGAEPGEIADVIVFLLSARAAYVTGAAWSVDGGTVPIII